MWMTLWERNTKQFITALIKFHIKYHSAFQFNETEIYV